MKLYDVFWRIADAQGNSWQRIVEVDGATHDEAHENALAMEIFSEYEDVPISIFSYEVNSSQGAVYKAKTETRWVAQ